MSDESLREQLYAAFKHRAMLYYLIFDELRAEIGEDRAAAIMKRAIRKRGEAIGQPFAKHGPSDLVGLRDAFLAGVPDGGRMFAARVDRCDGNGLDITLESCPLKDAWQDAGLDEQEIAKLCDIAGIIDEGTFVGAGFEFSAETWKPGCDGCCHLHVRPGPNHGQES